MWLESVVALGPDGEIHGLLIRRGQALNDLAYHARAVTSRQRR